MLSTLILLLKSFYTTIGQHTIRYDFLAITPEDISHWEYYLAYFNNSHFHILNTQNANGNMPNMILIAQLNENFSNCDENFRGRGGGGGGGGVNENPSFIPAMFCTQSKNERSAKTSFHIHLVIIKIKYNINLPEFQYTSTTESCLGSVPHAG